MGGGIAFADERCGPRPRRLTVATPSAPCERLSVWLESPRTPFEVGSDFISSTGLGDPCFCRSADEITSTGSAPDSEVPRIRVPVTTMSGPGWLSLAAGCAGAVCAAAGATITANAMAMVTWAQAPSKAVLPFMTNLPDITAFRRILGRTVIDQTARSRR